MDIPEVIDELQTHVESPNDFDPMALAWLKGLDIILDGDDDDVLDDFELRSFAGDPCQIRRRNNFIATYYEDKDQGVTWAADQSASFAAYARHHVLIPVGPTWTTDRQLSGGYVGWAGSSSPARERASSAPRHVLAPHDADQIPCARKPFG